MFTREQSQADNAVRFSLENDLRKRGGKEKGKKGMEIRSISVGNFSQATTIFLLLLLSLSLRGNLLTRSENYSPRSRSDDSRSLSICISFHRKLRLRVSRGKYVISHPPPFLFSQFLRDSSENLARQLSPCKYFFLLLASSLERNDLE